MPCHADRVRRHYTAEDFDVYHRQAAWEKFIVRLNATFEEMAAYNRRLYAETWAATEHTLNG